jgi:CubicO group peptidase (beta-lactamase class C family)
VSTGFPTQPADLPWPTQAWPEGDPAPDVDTSRLAAVLDRALAQPEELGVTLAVAVAHRGRLIVERYADGVDRDSKLISWSTAKSVMHALVGLLVSDGRLVLDAPAAVPEWQGASDARARITVQQLLEMRSGLRFVEDYVDAGISDCIEMLFGTGHKDVAHYAADLPLEHSPGTFWNYSSGTTNIVSRLVGSVVGGGEPGLRAFMDERLFGPLGMASASPSFDESGTFVGSSFLDCTALDFLRFAYLYLRGGLWEGEPLLPAGWADHARTPVPVPAEEDFGYGAHWWVWPDVEGMFAAHGYEGQYLLVVPDRDLAVVRLGKSPADLRPAVVATLREIVGSFR